MSTTAKKKIVVAQRGWVFVGDVRQEGDEVIIENCQNIRRWGTTKGLGQLALEGPQTNTVLDPAPVTRIHHLAVVFTYDCNESVWQQQ